MAKAAKELWASSRREEWQAALATYDLRLEQLATAKSKPDLVALDRWYRLELPAAVASRAPKRHIAASEVSDIMRWKLARGKFRPGLQNKADANSEANCKAATGAAFEAAEQAEGLLGRDLGIGETGGVGRELQKATIAAVEAMSKGPPKLQGIGPATASALLAAGNDCFPFMSDEAAEAALPSSTKLKYNVNEYWLFCAAARAKAAELSGDALADAAWSAVAVERALWAAAMGDKYGDLPSTAGVDSATEEQADGAPRSKRRKRA